jgi:hypothetical protein
VPDLCVAPSPWRSVVRRIDRVGSFLAFNHGLLAGETSFRTLSVGVTGGYYIHIGSNFYLYPTAAFTHNSVSGSTSINGTSYEVERFSPNASLHTGWEWGHR